MKKEIRRKKYGDNLNRYMKNGVLSLRTMKLRPYSARDILEQTMSCNYDENADCPKFKALLERLLPNEDTRKEFQKSCGIVLTKWYEPKSPIVIIPKLHSSDKYSVLRTILEYVIGSYGIEVDSSFVGKKKMDKCSKISIEDLEYYPMVYCSNFESSDRLDKAKVNSITNRIARPDRKPYTVDYYPISRIFIEGKPYISPDETVLWHKTAFFPFADSMTGIDSTLDAKLQLESPGIFNWLLEGLSMSSTEGLTETSQMLECKCAYIEEMKSIENMK